MDKNETFESGNIGKFQHLNVSDTGREMYIHDATVEICLAVYLAPFYCGHRDGQVLKSNLVRMLDYTLHWLAR